MATNDESSPRTLATAFTTHRAYLLRVARRRGLTMEEAADVVQDAFERAVRAKPDQGSCLRAWLATVVARLAVDARRRVIRRQARERASLPLAPGSTHHAEPELAWQKLRDCAARLPREAFLVWVLRDLLDYTVRETAGLLGWKENRVRTSLHRSRKRLSAAAERGAQEESLRRPNEFNDMLGSLLAGDDVLACALSEAAALRRDHSDLRQLLGTLVAVNQDGGPPCAAVHVGGVVALQFG